MTKEILDSLSVWPETLGNFGQHAYLVRSVPESGNNDTLALKTSELEEILQLARAGWVYLHGPRRRIELYDHPGKAVSDWRMDRRNGLCYRCPNSISCENMLHNGDKCFYAWGEMRVDKFPEEQRKAEAQRREQEHYQRLAHESEWEKKYPGLWYSDRDSYLRNDESIHLTNISVRIWNRLDPKLTIGEFLEKGERLFKTVPGIGKRSYEQLMTIRKSLQMWREDATKGETNGNRP